MAKKSQPIGIPLNTEVEIVIRKKATYGEYMQHLDAFRRKGWSAQAYQVGYYSEGTGENLIHKSE